jgi:hypothetical protein
MSLEMRLQAEIVIVRDALGGCNWARLEMHFGGRDRVTQRCTWRP